MKRQEGEMKREKSNIKMIASTLKMKQWDQSYLGGKKLVMIQHSRKIRKDTFSWNVEMKDKFDKKEDSISRKQKKVSTNG